MPLGMKIDHSNRWVEKSELIPWDEIEQRYADLFPSHKGNVAKPLRMALGALLIQTQYGYSDEEIALQIQETPCLQYFCGLTGYKDELPFDSSSMVHFRKRLTAEILGEINEMIISKTIKNEKPPPDDGTGTTNKGTLIADSTCAPQNIKYPQDTSLLNEAREDLEKIIDRLHKPREGVKPRTYRIKARQDYLDIAKRKNKTSKQIRRAVGKQLRYIRRDIKIVEVFIKNGKELSKWDTERYEIIKALYEQQLHMYENRVHTVENRIVSLGQPWVRPIVRGKAKDRCEFGAKLDISVADGFVRLEHTSFDAYNESGNLQHIIERYRERTGYYPERVLADKIYRNRDNLRFCKQNGIRLSGKPLGRPKREPGIDKKQEWRDQVDRIEVERKISHAKGSFGLGLIRAKLRETSKTAIALSIISLNLAFIGRSLFNLFFQLLQKNQFSLRICICAFIH